MIKSVADYLHTHHRNEIEAWDKWDYRIWSPLSLDDLAFVEVQLINRNKTKQSITIKFEK